MTPSLGPLPLPCVGPLASPPTRPDTRPKTALTNAPVAPPSVADFSVWALLAACIANVFAAFRSNENKKLMDTEGLSVRLPLPLLLSLSLILTRPLGAPRPSCV